jgi:hypothetical protein
MVMMNEIDVFPYLKLEGRMTNPGASSDEKELE